MSLSRVQPLLRRLSPAASTATRQMTTASWIHNEDWIPEGSKRDTKMWMPNGSMKRGPGNFTNTWVTKEGAFWWILMPGVSKEKLTLNVVANRIYIEGSEDPDCHGMILPSDVVTRAYKGSLLVNPTLFDASRVKAELVNGIFWVHIPRLPAV